MARLMQELEFRLEIDFDEFSEASVQIFCSELAELAECEPIDIVVLSIKPGCVILRIRMPKGAAKRVVALYMKNELTNDGKPEVCPIAFQQFLARYTISDLKELEVDMNIVIKSKPKEKAIILVHGWSGGDSTFGDLPEILADEFACPVTPYDYPTGVWEHSPSIVYVADALGAWIDAAHSDKRLALVSHSMGGLVARRFVVAQSGKSTRLDLNVSHMVFLASPHEGSAYAQIAAKIPGISSEQISDLSPNSPVLYDLTTRWKSWVKAYVPDSCRIRSMFGTKDKVVPTVSAIGEDEEAIPLLGRTHMNIVKPSGVDDPLVVSLRAFLGATGFGD